MSTRKRNLPATASAAAVDTSAELITGLNDNESRIYRSVFESVMNQRIAPGTKLPEQALCALFDVNRATVRKVLQRLAHDHIVDLRPNRGAVVAAPTPEETRQIFEARQQLEAAVVPLVAQRITKAEIGQLRKQLREEHAALHRADQPAWARLASGFHLRLAELSGNAILHRYLHELISRCSLIVALYEPPGNAACEHEEHARIVDHIENGEPAKAVKVMQEHLLDLEQRICLDKPQSEKSLAQMLGLV
ncbi:GntR family transcriptional regulator [Variovorax sp. HJSM1_2]|uniref:GntR family transcriptional regulator n=1 Tax=Variovorax sp. HJSM1_2 TaxID=3366263 RepID=UPI003BC0B117